VTFARYPEGTLSKVEVLTDKESVMVQLLITLFLVFILLNGYICQSISWATGKALAALETAPDSVSEPGEWVMEGYNPQRNRAAPTQISPPLKLVQELSLGGETPVGSPVVVAGDLLLVEGNHQLYALSQVGAERWAVILPGSFLSPAIAGKTIFVRAETGKTGYLMALRAGSGETLWQFKFPEVGSRYGDMGGHVTSPVVVEGLVLAGAGQAFYALNAETGQTAWVFQMDEPVSSSAAISDETVFFSDFKGLYAVDLKTGIERWRFVPETGTVARLFAPVVSEGYVITTSGETAYALDPQTGHLLWQRSIPPGNLIPAGVDGEHLYVKATRRLYALDRASGAELWSFQAANFVSLPAITREHLYVITRAGGKAQLRVLDRRNGQEIWQVEEERLSNTSPVIARGGVYVRTVDGWVWVYEPAVEK
jgi:outer membrane protein assembly factor BamB